MPSTGGQVRLKKPTHLAFLLDGRASVPFSPMLVRPHSPALYFAVLPKWFVLLLLFEAATPQRVQRPCQSAPALPGAPRPPPITEVQRSDRQGLAPGLRAASVSRLRCAFCLF